MITPAAHHLIPDIALPNETLTAVFDELSPSTLALVTRVSHRFNAVAERMLYASVFILDFLAEASPIPSKTLRWCESLLQRPHLLSATRKIHIRWHSDPQYPPPRHLTTPIVKLADVLGFVQHLESLELFLGPANLAPTCLEPIHAIERVVRSCSFPMLRYCSLGAEWVKGSQPYTHVLASFLASLPSLRHLKLQDHHSALNIPPQALPFLTSFRGSPDTAAYLLPGRPVQYLSLLGQDSDVNRENLPRMTDTSLPLRYLDLSAISARPMLLRNVSAYMPGIEVLKVKLALRHTLHYALSGIRLLAGLSSVLSAFHQLTFLDLSLTPVDGVGTADAAEEVALCREWKRACPSLRRIIFPSYSEWVCDDNSNWVFVQHGGP